MRPGVTVSVTRCVPRMTGASVSDCPPGHDMGAADRDAVAVAELRFGTVTTDRLFAAKRLVVELGGRDVCLRSNRRPA